MASVIRLLLAGDVSVAGQWAGYAKKLASFCIRDNIPKKVVNVDGSTTITVTVANNDAKVTITAGGGYQFLAVTWLPVGLVLTPKTESVPYGYGSPRRDTETGERINPPFGTPIASLADEGLNQVLINQFENNQYLDRKGFVSGIPTKNEKPLFELPDDNPRLRDSLAVKAPPKPMTVMYWPVFFEPTDVGETFWQSAENRINWPDVPGIDRWDLSYNYNTWPRSAVDEDGNVTGVLPSRQFDDAGNALLYETETTEWYCHWPEELLYDNDAYEALFKQTNEYRNEVGRKPLIRELRGHANTARMVTSECQRARVLYHNNAVLYRQGYTTVEDRVSNAGSNFDAYGENLLIGGVGGFAVSTGLKAADMWRHSPPHYANMISFLWDSPASCTSHNIMGNVQGVAVAQESVGVLNPPARGRFWSQLFTMRKSWVATGNITQVTRYGAVSFIKSNGGPLGLVNSVADYNEIHVFVKGRRIVVTPLYDLALDGFSIAVLGAAICKIENVLCLRVFAIAYKSTLDYYVYVRPLNANHAPWVTEGTQQVESLILTYSTATFDYEGEKAVLSRIKFEHGDKANYYLPKQNNQFDAITASASVMEYSGGQFTVVGVTKGPEINYTVTTEDKTVNGVTTTYITRYLQECDNADGISVHPFYATELKYLKIRYHWKINQTRTTDDAPVYNNEWEILETLVLPSGKEITLKSLAAQSNPAKTQMVLGSGGYVVIFLYLDPINEDMVYIKIALRGQDTIVYGTATIYADLHDNEELQTIASFPESVLDANALNHPNMNGSWIGEPTAATVCADLIEPSVVFERDSSGRLYPIFMVASSNAIWRCTGYTGDYRAYATKPKTGLHSGRLDMVFGDSSNCYNSASDLVMNFTYAANLKITHYGIDGIGAWAARYKDKFVVQIKVNMTQQKKLWNIPFTKKDTVWANFDLNTMVGIGDLSSVHPLGVIL